MVGGAKRVLGGWPWRPTWASHRDHVTPGVPLTSVRLHPQRLPGLPTVQSRRPSPGPGLGSLAPLSAPRLLAAPNKDPCPLEAPGVSHEPFPLPRTPVRPSGPSQLPQTRHRLLSRHLLRAAPHADPVLPRCLPDPGGGGQAPSSLPPQDLGTLLVGAAEHLRQSPPWNREAWVQTPWSHLPGCLPSGLSCSKESFRTPVVVGRSTDHSLKCSLADT